MKNKYKVLIITCWILLILAVIAKLFGADWFLRAAGAEVFGDCAPEGGMGGGRSAGG